MRRITLLIYLLSMVVTGCNNEEVQQYEEVNQKNQTVLESGAVVTLSDGIYHWQGDIMLSNAQFHQLNKTGDIIDDEKDIDIINITPVMTTSGYLDLSGLDLMFTENLQILYISQII